ncbi:maleylpyruvate isomerase N-terminal domain-containing protein [Streptomyces sp. NPDC059534]|uniref:maleylpyruvate isomerase N-terminal domain-containing protein n=1 Tax=Streptomyces sp. NPDC059534 TaxID=3346859 RepID=UPI0036881EAE
MGTVTRFDPVVEHERTRAALADAVPRLVRLMRDVPGRKAPSGVPVWTVGDVGAHLASVYLAYCSLACDDQSVEWDSVLPPGDGSLTERITAMNATAVTLFGDDERAHLADFLAGRGETFLRDTQGLAPDTPIAVPWFKQDLTLAALTGLMLSESLVHGLDIARGAGLPWPIGPHEASLVLGQTMPTMMTLALDTTKAQGVTTAFDLVVRNGPRLAVVIDNGTMTVTRDAPPRSYDCRLTVSPVAFLLVSFRRIPLWKAIARGRLRAGGRKPWLALRLGELIANP